MTPRERWWLALISVSATGLTVGILALVPAMPEIQQALDIPTSQVSWFAAAYLIPTVVLTIPAGVLLARARDPGRMFALALLCYAVTGSAQAATDSYSAILALRVAQGVSVALAMPMTITIIADVFEGGRQLRALSVRQVVLTLSGIAWPLVGTALATVHWQLVFLLQGLLLPMGLALLIHPPPTARALDTEKTFRTGLISQLRRQPTAVQVLLLNFARYFFLFAIVAYGPVLLVTEADHSLTQAGLLVAGVSAASAVASERMEWLVGRLRPARLATSACVLMGSGLVVIAASPAHWWFAFAAGLVAGTGDGILGVLGDSYVARLWQAEVRRAMAAVTQTFRNAGKLLGPLAITALLVATTLPAAFAAMGVLALATGLLLVPLRTLDVPPPRPPGVVGAHRDAGPG